MSQHPEIFPSATRYFIEKELDHWRIKFGTEVFGPYRTQNEAMLFALDAAKALGARGEAVEVCLLGENGHFHREWTSYGPDAVPPSKSDR